MPRIRLRTLFLIFFCAAIGLTCGMAPTAADIDSINPELNWHHALLAAASVAIVIGLLQQANRLRRRHTIVPATSSEFHFARLFGIAWRIVIAVSISACLVLQLLVSRKIISLPDNDEFLYLDSEPIPDAL